MAESTERTQEQNSEYSVIGKFHPEPKAGEGICYITVEIRENTLSRKVTLNAEVYRIVDEDGHATCLSDYFELFELPAREPRYLSTLEAIITDHGKLDSSWFVQDGWRKTMGCTEYSYE